MVMMKEDPKARERSLMYKNPTVCDGQRDGKQCKHYWFSISRIDVINPDELRRGRKDRFCILLGTPYSMGDGSSEMATYCNQYDPSDKDYDPVFAINNPMTEEEVLALRGELPASSTTDTVTVVSAVGATSVDAGTVSGGSIFSDDSDDEG